MQTNHTCCVGDGPCRCWELFDVNIHRTSRAGSSASCCFQEFVVRSTQDMSCTRFSTSSPGTKSKSGGLDELLDNLQQATDAFASDQELRLQQFRAEMEKLLVQQQRDFEQNMESRPSRDPENDEETTDERKPLMEQHTSKARLDTKNANTSEIDNLYTGIEQVSTDILPFNSHNDWEAFVNKRRLNFDCLEKVVHHPLFAALMSILIFLNSAYIGFSTSRNFQALIVQYNDLEVKAAFEAEPEAWQDAVDYFFIICFTAELVMRILGEELVFFFGADWAWNFMDALLVTSALMDKMVAIDG